MNKTVMAAIAVILLVVVLIMFSGKNNPTEISKLPKMKPVEKLTMMGSSSSSSSVMINGKEVTGSPFSNKLLEKMEKCQKFQQSALDGYMFYQIWGWQNGKCVYKELINTGLMGSEKTSWKTLKECNFDTKQLEEFVEAMKDPNGKQEMRTIKNGNSRYMLYSSYYNYLLKKYEIEGVCKELL